MGAFSIDDTHLHERKSHPIESADNGAAVLSEHYKKVWVVSFDDSTAR